MSAAAKPGRAHVTDARFPQIGGRDYIQGISIVQAMADAALDAVGAGAPSTVLHVERAKFNAKTLCDGTIFVAADGDERSLPRAPAATLVARLDSRPVAACYVPDRARPVATRLPDHEYAIDDLETDGAYAGGCRITARDSTKFLLSLVEANKRIVTMCYGAAPAKPVVELVDLENLDYRRTGMFESGPLLIRNLAIRKFGGRIYILNRLEYTEPAGTARSLRFTFSACSAGV